MVTRCQVVLLAGAMAMNVGVEAQGVHLIVIFGAGHHLTNWLEYEYVRSATGYSLKKVNLE